MYTGVKWQNSKGKEIKILKSSRKVRTFAYKGIAVKLMIDFLNISGNQKAVERVLRCRGKIIVNLEVHSKQNYHSRIRIEH